MPNPELVPEPVELPRTIRFQEEFKPIIPPPVRRQSSKMIFF
jgi:hypothetical protein